MFKTILFIGLGGAIGSILRYGVGVIIKHFVSTTFPFATFAINIIGCFIIGLLYGYSDKYSIGNSAINYFLIVGFCGSFTTFSTFANENLNLIQQQNIFIPILYIISSIIFGILSVKLGYKIIY